MEKIKKNIDPEELARVKKHLTEFLCLKFDYANEELEKKIEDPEASWETKLSNWDAIRQILTFKPTPDTSTYPYRGPMDKRPITVILPKDPAKNFQFLKAAAYFPWQLEPNCIYPKYAEDENVLTQLAFATKYGMFLARSYIWAATGMYPLLPSNHRFNTVGNQSVNHSDYYYELALPEEYWGERKIVEKKVPFNPKTDTKKTLEFFDYLLEIAKKDGKRPEKVTYT